MTNKNVVDIKSALNKQKHKKSLFVITTLLITVLFSWNFIVESYITSGLEITKSDNIAYSTSQIDTVTTNDIIQEIERNKGNPILMHFYTTWCKVCRKSVPNINELARKYQNTNLKVISVAINKNLLESTLKIYLEQYGNIYFAPKHLLRSNNFTELMQKKGIKFRGRVPLTVVISSNNKIISQFSGYKSLNYVNRKILIALSHSNHQI